jgi:hypothetical protein
MTGTAGSVVVVVGAGVVDAAFAVDPGAVVVAFAEVETAVPAELGGVTEAPGAALAAHEAASIEKPTNSTEARRDKGV